MKMNQELVVNAIHASTTEVFATMLGLEVIVQEAYTETHAPGPSGGIIAVVGLAGAWVGTVNICCNLPLACQITSAMLGADYSDAHEDVLDAISEIANMVVGGFKTTAEIYLGPMGISIPTVIYGLNFCARSAAKEQWIVVPFACVDHLFEVKICLTPNRGLPNVDTRDVASLTGSRA